MIENVVMNFINIILFVLIDKVFEVMDCERLEIFFFNEECVGVCCFFLNFFFFGSD